MKISRKLIERMVIVADNSRRDEALQLIEQEGFRQIYSGARPKGKGLYDRNAFKLIAERELNV